MMKRPGLEVFAELPGKVIWMTQSVEGGLLVYYENPKRWWQFWKPEIARKHFCSHGNEWDDYCPQCFGSSI